MECSICGHPIESKDGWDQGNNAEPIKEGRCCDWCNDSLVIPLRLRMSRGDLVIMHGLRSRRWKRG